jgi:hypothetical protein
VNTGKLNFNQRELVLKYIADFGYITSFQAYQDLGITQLATRIKELKDRGYQFKTVNVKTKNRYGKPSHYYKYYLIDKVS